MHSSNSQVRTEPRRDIWPFRKHAHAKTAHRPALARKKSPEVSGAAAVKSVPARIALAGRNAVVQTARNKLSSGYA